MANTKGSAENPFTVDDLPDPAAYIQIDSDGEVTELAAHAVPVSSRAHKRGNNSRHGTTTSGSASFASRNARSIEREISRSPSTKPSSCATRARLRDNDELEGVAQQAPQQNKISDFTSEAKETRPPVSDQYSSVSSSRLPERAKLDVSSTGAPKSPIGNRAAAVQEQTTLGHVEQNATLEPTRADTINRAERISKSPEVAAKTCPTRILNTFKPSHKPRAIKTAASPPLRKLDTHRSKIRPARYHARSPDHAQGPREYPLISTSPGRNREEEGQFFESHIATVGDRQPAGRSSEDQGFTRPDVSSSKMGAQMSALTTSLVPVLSSEKPGCTTRETPIVCPPKPQSDVADIDAARRDIEVSLKLHLDGRYEDHAYLVKNAMWIQRTCFEREKRAECNGKQSQTVSALAEKFLQSVSPFDKISPIQISYERSSKAPPKDFTQEVFTKASPKDTVVKSSWSVQPSRYKPAELCIPPFKEYVSLRNNILADNESKILTIPWLDDDDEEAQKVLRDKLSLLYEIKYDLNATMDLRNEQCRFYTEVVGTFLADMNLTWDAILFWLLSPDKRILQISKSIDKHEDFEAVLLDRQSYSTELFHRAGDEKEAVLFERGSDQWEDCMHQLKEPSAVQLRVAALASAALLSNCNFNPWYMVEQCKTMQDYVLSKTKAAEIGSKISPRDVVCRICHEHKCMFHGQIREELDSSSESEASTEEDVEENQTRKSPQPIESSDEDDLSSDDSGFVPAHVDEEDSDLEKVINYRLPANPEVVLNKAWPRHAAAKQLCKAPPSGPFKARWWEVNTNTVTWEKRKPFVPCNHAGSCTEAKCRCFSEGVTCEKTCKCSQHCNRRFPGCKCAILPGKRTCSTVTSCLCVRFKRECDADLCGTCGATEVLDPVNRYDEYMLQGRCTNVGIQRGVPKKTLLGQSEVHGFGLYAGEDIHKDDIVGEYTGEILSVEESARRELMYEYEKNMYLFKLNKKQEVDATHMGNKLRFINNAHAHLSNCIPKNLFCNTVFRIALFATTDIKAGTELFFHYNYPAELTENFKQPRAKMVAVKQVVKQPVKAKLKRGRPSEPSSAGAYVDRPRNLESLALARAAKAAKRAAMLAEKALQVPPSSCGTGLRQARKSASSGPISFQKLNHSAQGRPKKALESDIPGNSAADANADSVAPARIIQDTDEEDDNFMPESTRGGTEGIEKDGNEIPPSASSVDPRRPRPRAAKSASVVVVKNLKKKMDGARPGAGRKRKRPVVLNSDDE